MTLAPNKSLQYDQYFGDRATYEVKSSFFRWLCPNENGNRAITKHLELGCSPIVRWYNLQFSIECVISGMAPELYPNGPCWRCDSNPPIFLLGLKFLVDGGLDSKLIHSTKWTDMWYVSKTETTFGTIESEGEVIAPKNGNVSHGWSLQQKTDIRLVLVSSLHLKKTA